MTRACLYGTAMAAVLTLAAPALAAPAGKAACAKVPAQGRRRCVGIKRHVPGCGPGDGLACLHHQEGVRQAVPKYSHARPPVLPRLREGGVRPDEQLVVGRVLLPGLPLDGAASDVSAL